MARQLTKRNMLEIMLNEMNNDYSTFQNLYRDINDFLLPSSGRFLSTDYNKGDRRNLKIINSTGTGAADTLHAGMMSGITSPARPWYRLQTPDPDLNEFTSVKEWLYLVENRMNMILAKSNLYNSLNYRDLGGFGTAPMSIEEDWENVIHCSNYPIGSYRLAQDQKGRVDTFAREYPMTVKNLIAKFGRVKNGQPDWSNFSTYVRNLYERGNYQTTIQICHIVYPNQDYVFGSPFNTQKKWSSCYYERGMSSAGAKAYMDSDQNDQNRYLKESGFDYFPFTAPRWRATPEDVYATDCPGITALGDIKQLQHSEKKFGKALDKMVDPTMVMPVSMQNTGVTNLPGGVMFADVRDGLQGIKAAHEVNLRIDHLDAKIDKIEFRIKERFYTQLFLLIASSQDRDRTAREIDERHEEKLLALGPVLERLNTDQNDQIIDITFNIALKRKLIPPPPAELEGMQLKIEYISIMAQAQKMLGVSVQERFMSTILGIIPVVPSVADKVDFDQWVDHFGENLSMAPKVIRSDKAVADLRAARAEQQEQKDRAAMIPGAAQAAKNLSQAPIEGDNALAALTDAARTGQLAPQ